MRAYIDSKGYIIVILAFTIHQIVNYKVRGQQDFDVVKHHCEKQHKNALNRVKRDLEI